MYRATLLHKTLIKFEEVGQRFKNISANNNFIAYAYNKSRDFCLILRDREKTKQLIRNQLFNPTQTDELKATSIGFGVFMGIIPIWGFQLLMAIFLSVVFKLNKTLVIIAAHISFAPMIPLIVYLSYKTGGYWMGSRNVELQFNSHLNLKTIGDHLEQYIYGSITLAIVAGMAVGLLSLLLLKVLKRKPASAF